MPCIEIEYTGEDIVIPREMIEGKLGVHKGDQIYIYPKIELVPVERTPEEVERIREILARTAGSWSEEDVEQFNALRKKLWESWRQPEYA